MKSNSLVNTPAGLTFTLHPYLSPKIGSSESIPVLRDTLEELTDRLEAENPGMQFDYSLMDKLPRKNLWFVDIL